MIFNGLLRIRSCFANKSYGTKSNDIERACRPLERQRKDGEEMAEAF